MNKPPRFLGVLFACAIAAGSAFGQPGGEAKSAAKPVVAAKVAMYQSTGTSGAGPKMLAGVFAASADFQLDRVTLAEVKAGKLNGYQAFIVPGGTSATIGKALGEGGRQGIRDFVNNGGAYVGICAGCYLSTCQYPWSLHILPAKLVDPKNSYRGRAKLQLEPTAEGKQWFSRDALQPKTVYHNGPVLEPLPDAPTKLIPLAHYREEITRKGAKEGLMLNTPAIAAARFGKGWVVGISPHPEQTDGLKDVVPSVIRWTLAHSDKD